MDISTVASERLTAIISTVVAVAILGAAVAAQQPARLPQDELVRLESDLRFQIKRMVRFNGQKSATCTAQLQRAVELWKQAEPSEENRHLFAQWLRQSMVNTMPGSEMILPDLPSLNFSPQSPSSEQPKTTGTSEQQQPPQQQSLTTELPTVAPKPVEPDPTVAVVVVAQDTTQNPLAEPSPRRLASQTSDWPIARIALQTPSARNKIGETSVLTTSVSINLSELTARTAGYHDGLDQIEATLLATSSPSDSLLAMQVGRLNSLARDYRFVKLYYDSLDEWERRSVIAPRPLSKTIARLRRQFDLSSSRDQLASLRRQLESIASSVD